MMTFNLGIGHKVLAVAIVCILLAVSLYAFPVDEDNDVDGVIPDDPELAEWTFMVYLDADNNLEAPGIEDVNEMEEVGSTDDVNIVVLFDRCEGYDTTNGDWEDTRLYYVTKDNDTETINSHLLEEKGELNMGDPQNLVDFVLQSMELYPARKYALSLWDHGAAFYGVAFDDLSDGDRIEMLELEWAMDEIYNTSGNKVDVVGFDACLMAELAVFYEIYLTVDYIAASETTEAGDGWPYELICADLVANPVMTGDVLAATIGQRYVESYGADILVTQSSWNCSRLDAVFNATDVLAQLMMDRLEEWLLLEKVPLWDARENTESADPPRAMPYMPDVLGYPMYDIWDFCYELKTRVAPDTEMVNACTELQAALDYARIWEGHSAEKRDFHGVTVYFPDDSSGAYPYDDRFEQTSYAEDRLWDDFIRMYNEE